MLERICLNGTWRLRGNDGLRCSQDYASLQTPDETKYIDAEVPGEVHLDLMRAGRIADPYVGANVLSCRWVEEQTWSYRRWIDVPEGAVRPGTHSWLYFEGLDYDAAIFIDGKQVARHANSFTPCRVELTGQLTPGRHLLVITLDSGLHHIADKVGAGYYFTYDQRLHKRHWLRKPQSQFGWDWAPRLINVGIHKSGWFEWTAAPLRLEQTVMIATVSPDLQDGQLRVRTFVENLKSSPAPVTVDVQIEGTASAVTINTQIDPGVHAVEAVLSIKSPDLWWPRGHGSACLYNVTVAVRCGAEPVGTIRKRVGFRHVRINQAPHPAQGQYFVIEVNGQPVFAKGGNLVPADMIFARIDRPRYEKLIQLAIEQHFNTLRVWGGGLYEADEFYELCDEQGILVWQEFIYACSRYPHVDEEFARNALTEARYQVRRLASHPSLIVWCGNNENEMFAWIAGFDRTGAILPDYGFYHHVLPRMLAEEDPSRHYQPSSPWSPNAEHPQADHVGDQHPWSVGFQDTDFRKYRQMICRFPNEGGMLGPTSLPTMRHALGTDLTQHRPASFAWHQHDNSVNAWSEPGPADEFIRNCLGREPRDMSVEEFVYWAGLIQGEGLREYIDNFRRRMFDSAAAIFWMYNDTWPATRSWTTVDYHLRRTPAFWPARRAMQPVQIVVADTGSTVTVFGVNDTRTPVNGHLRYGIMQLAGGAKTDLTVEATLGPNASTPLVRFPRDLWTEPTRSFAFAMLTDANNHLIGRGRLFLPVFREMEWPEAQLQVDWRDGRARFTSDAFAWGVCIDVDGETPLGDNFFDVWPGIPYFVGNLPNQATPTIRIANGTCTVTNA